jgi:hypothetical protein
MSDLVQSTTEALDERGGHPVTVDADLEASSACISALIEHGIPVDMIELLVRGSLRQGIKPGALTKAIKATIISYRRSEVLERALRGAS